MLIDGSVALVTGTDRALGAAFANALLDRGAAKVYAAASDASSIADQRLIPVRLDVTDCASIEEATKAAPDVSLLINNAGIDTGPPSVALGEEAALRLALEVGYRRPVAVSRAFAPVVGANGGGALVNMLCGLAWFTLPNPGGYSSARAAMWAATNSLREDVVAQRTLVTAVLARYLDTGAAGGADGARTTPEAVAIATLDGVEAGEHEVLIDDFAQQVHSGSSGPLIGLHPSGYSWLAGHDVDSALHDESNGRGEDVAAVLGTAVSLASMRLCVEAITPAGSRMTKEKAIGYLD